MGKPCTLPYIQYEPQATSVGVGHTQMHSLRDKIIIITLYIGGWIVLGCAFKSLTSTT